MRRIVLWIMVFVFVLSGTLFAYDKELAKRLNMMFSPMTPEVIAKKPCMVNVKQLLEMIKNKEDFVILDVRTPQEMAVFGITLKNKLEIPLNELFKEENLNKLPTDKKIIVVCHTGGRAIPAALGLHLIGFKNVFVLEDGLTELAKQVGRDTYKYVELQK